MKPTPETKTRNSASGAEPLAHLSSAVHSLQGILSRRAGQYTFLVEIREADQDDAATDMSSLARKSEVGPVCEDPDPTLNRDASPATNGTNDHGR